MQCPICKTEHSANFCPNCGAPANNTPTPQAPPAQPPYQQPIQPVPPPKKKGGCVKWGVIILAALIVIGVLGAIFAPSSSRNTNNNSSGDVSTNSANAGAAVSSEPVPETISLGTAVEVGSFSIQINSSSEANRINSDDAGYIYYEPEDGAKYIVVNVTLKNIDKEMKSFDASDFQMYTNDGVRYSPSILIITGSEQYFTIESMNPGIEKTGNVAFQVPADMDISDLYIEYSPSFSSDNQKFEIQ